MKRLILIVFGFVFLQINAQESIFTSKWYPGLHLNWGVWSELQLGLDNYYLNTTKSGHGFNIGVGYNFRENAGLVTQLGYSGIHLSSAFLYGITNVSFKYYPLSDNHLALAPEIGFGIFCLLIAYQPNIVLLRGDNVQLPVHQFRIVLTFNPVPLFGPSLRFGASLFKRN